MNLISQKRTVQQWTGSEKYKWEYKKIADISAPQWHKNQQNIEKSTIKQKSSYCNNENATRIIGSKIQLPFSLRIISHYTFKAL